MKKIKNGIIIIMIGIIIISLIFAVKDIITNNNEIDQSISEDFISDSNIVEGIKKEKSKIKKEEAQEIIIREIIIVVISITGIVIVNKKMK